MKICEAEAKTKRKKAQPRLQNRHIVSSQVSNLLRL